MLIAKEKCAMFADRHVKTTKRVIVEYSSTDKSGHTSDATME